MFINFWYPVDLTENVRQKELRKVRMLGQDFVVFRDEYGTARCISNVCIHRGGSLADGKHKGNCVECPYHGWMFDGDGECKRIPSLGPDATIPENARIDAYPIVEKYGLVFAFLGDLPEDERPPITECVEWGREGWRSLVLNYQWNANYQRLVENQADPSHVEYVHSGMGFQGERKEYSVPEFEIDETEWGAGAMTRFYSRALPDKVMRPMMDEGQMDAGAGFLAVSQTWTKIHFNQTDHMNLYLYFTPVDQFHLNIFLVAARNAMLDPEKDANFEKRLMFVAEEDRVVVEKLEPVLPPPVDTCEMIVPADDILMIYRRKLKEWEARGWRMDLKKIEDDCDRIAYAIPSPSRRNIKGWPVPAVPTIKRSERANAAAE